MKAVIYGIHHHQDYFDHTVLRILWPLGGLHTLNLELLPFEHVIIGSYAKAEMKAISGT